MTHAKTECMALKQGSQTRGRMRPAKALFVARDTLSEIQKIWDNNKSFQFILQHFCDQD